MQIYNVQKVKRAWIGGAGKSRHVGYVTLGNCIEIAKKLSSSQESALDDSSPWTLTFLKQTQNVYLSLPFDMQIDYGEY